jgi:hypothetical protein
VLRRRGRPLDDRQRVLPPRGAAADPACRPSWADAGHYPLAWCGIALLLRRRGRRFHANVWLDGLVAALAAAAGAAAALPAIVSATGGPSQTVAAEQQLPGRRPPPPRCRRRLPGGDRPAPTDRVAAARRRHRGLRGERPSFLLRIAAGSEHIGTPWDAGWMIALMALAAWRSEPGRPEPGRPERRPGGRLGE